MLVSEYALALSDYQGIEDELGKALEGKATALNLSPQAKGALLTLKSNNHLALLAAIVRKIKQIKDDFVVIAGKQERDKKAIGDKVSSRFGPNARCVYVDLDSKANYLQYRNLKLDVSQAHFKKQLIDHLQLSSQELEVILKDYLATNPQNHQES